MLTRPVAWPHPNRWNVVALQWHYPKLTYQNCKFKLIITTRMRSIATDGVSMVCRHDHEPSKSGWTDRDAVWDDDSGGPKQPRIGWGSSSPHVKGQLWGRKRACPGHAQTLPAVDIHKVTQQGAALEECSWKFGVLYRVHIGATWRLRLNRPCASAMRPDAKLTLTAVLVQLCTNLMLTAHIIQQWFPRFLPHSSRHNDLVKKSQDAFKIISEVM